MIFSFKIRKGFGRAYFQGGLSEIYGIHTNRNMKRLVYCRYGQYRIISTGGIVLFVLSTFRIGSTPTFHISICISTLPTQHTVFLHIWGLRLRFVSSAIDLSE